MNTQYARSPDGTQIAFDVTGQGAALILLHGGGHSRQHWHDVGYVDRLKTAYQVIALDIRGNGQSDRPTDQAAYTTDKLGQDILAVADTCGVQRFVIWGFSYGGNVGRYLAAQSERVAGIVIIGIPFGLGASGDFRASIERMRSHWLPILQAQRDNALDWNTLSEEDRTTLQERNVALSLAWLSAMLDWRAIAPKDLRCPALWLIGSDNSNAMTNLKECQPALPDSQVRVQVIEGLTHMQEFTEIGKVLPAMLDFTRMVWNSVDK
jgi:pimeloyl-ACP methyl ester carboxylesterase